MRTTTASVEPRGTSLVVLVPQTRRERARGLLGAVPLGAGRAMLFVRARSVHTVGMRAPITVAFLDRDLRVIRVRPLAPGRLAMCLRARHVLESDEGCEVRLGDTLRLDAAGEDAGDRTHG